MDSAVASVLAPVMMPVMMTFMVISSHYDVVDSHDPADNDDDAFLG